MKYYLGVARDKGVTDDEIGAVQSIVMAVHAGRIRAQFRAARERGGGVAPPGPDPASC